MTINPCETAVLFAYDRGWSDCLEAVIPVVEKFGVHAVAVLRQTHDNPPSLEAS